MKYLLIHALFFVLFLPTRAYSTIKSAKLVSENLLSIISGTKVELTAQLDNVFEGSWVHKYKGEYYLTYPRLQNNQWPEIMYYVTAKKPLRPYTYRGVYIGQLENQSGTNHASVVKYKGDWLAFYHATWLSDGLSESRNLLADYLYYNFDGSIKPSRYQRGIGKGRKNFCNYKLEAENAKKLGEDSQELKFQQKRVGFLGEDT